MAYYCNPLNVDYRYQFIADPRNPGGQLQINREAADPSMILFQGRYYLFASMSLSVWVSDDLAHWSSHPLPETLPLYDYAPDVRVVGEWVYFSASRRSSNCDFYRTRDILHGPYERIPGSFPFWDPNLFADEDGRLYFYWGCSNATPIYGVEMDPDTMRPKTEPISLIEGHPETRGYERCGENHSDPLVSDAEAAVMAQRMLSARGAKLEDLPAETQAMVKGMFTNRPYIEGAWMTRHEGRYYLQYAFPGTQWNIYGDGVYVSDAPLGPFVPAENNPYSYQPGSFLPGAGHGSTMESRDGKLWHAATMRISMNHQFERRVGIWPAGFDADGELFCAQRYGDWPINTEGGDPWREPDWMLLSRGAAASASSAAEGHAPALAVDENVQTWWRAADAQPGQWLALDLGRPQEVHAVQINFADDGLDLPAPGDIRPGDQPRFIDPAQYPTRWTLEGSEDGEHWQMLCDKSQAESDLPHDVVWLEEGRTLRHLRLTVLALPYGQAACVSGLRVFGRGAGEKPAAPAFTAVRTSPMDMTVDITPNGAVGYNILWGHRPDKLYHSWLTYEPQRAIGALVEGQEYYVRVDAFNEAGITHGETVIRV